MEFCAACEKGKNAHVEGSQNEMERIWELAERIWTLDQQKEEAPARSWDEMFFGGGDMLVNWSGAPCEQGPL